MAPNSFRYTSKIISLTVADNGSNSQHSIHRCILLQLPYFKTLLSERWEREVSNDRCLELPPLSSIEDFNCLIETLYLSVHLPAPANVDRAVGILALVKMMQTDPLIEQALANIRKLTATDGQKLRDAIGMLDGLSTMEDAIRALTETTVAFDDEIFASAIRECCSPAHSALLSSAMSSRATFGHRNQDIMAILNYMNTPVRLPKSDRFEVPPFLTYAEPAKHQGAEWAEQAKAARKSTSTSFPLCLKISNDFSSLWNVVHPLVSTHDQFVVASKVFAQITTEMATCFESSDGGSRSRSGKTYYPGPSTYHKIAPCALIPHKVKTDDPKEEDKNDRADANPVVGALCDLLLTGIRLVKSGDISMKEFIVLVDCASPKTMDYHGACTAKACRILRKTTEKTGISLTDEQLAAFLERAKLELGADARPIAKHLFTSDRWGLGMLGPSTTDAVQQILL